MALTPEQQAAAKATKVRQRAWAAARAQRYAERAPAGDALRRALYASVEEASRLHQTLATLYQGHIQEQLAMLDRHTEAERALRLALADHKRQRLRLQAQVRKEDARVQKVLQTELPEIVPPSRMPKSRASKEATCGADT